MLSGKRVLVLGLGDTGLSMAVYLAREGARVRVADDREEPPMAGRLAEVVPDAVLHTGPLQADSFQGIDLIAISPGVDQREPLIAKAVSRGIEVVGDVELFARALSAPAFSDGAATPPPKVVGITGSNGKTTVTALIGEMCRRAGCKTVVAGNIGLPVLDAWLETEHSGAPDVYVLELSSFQLETVASLNFSAATVLNVSEDHMDRYAGIADYAAAKARIYRNTAVPVVNRDDATVMAMVQGGADVYSFGLDLPHGNHSWGIVATAAGRELAEGDTRLLAQAELSLAGLHNAANALAALALARAIGLPYPPLLETLRHFKGLPHRVEKVTDIDGVDYFDDSKGTNVGATVAALSGMGALVVLIAGGDGKGQNFAPLKDVVGKHARAVILIGRDAALIDSAICASQVPIEHAASLQAAVQRAAAIAQAGDAVLLSPACASFDMFRNYVHRAEVFIDAVMALKKAAGRPDV